MRSGMEKGPAIGNEPWGGICGVGFGVGFGGWGRGKRDAAWDRQWRWLGAVPIPELVWDGHRDLWGRRLPDSHAFSQAPEAPPALETLRVVQRGEHSLRLRWQPVPGVRGFRLRWRPEGERCPPVGG